ncbi:MAG: trypsin-like peptidase domain-containing protein [Acidobacteriota bacterium]
MTLKDHLRSLSDKQPPDKPKESSDSPVAPPSDPPRQQSSISLETVTDCLVNVLADGKSGKGFMIDGEGRIATNCQLVKSANKIKITTRAGDIFLGKVIRLDETRDLALIQIPSKTPTYMTLGDPNSVDVGENVYTLESPSSENLTETVISALRGSGGTVLIQTDRPIDPANSGSPVVTAQGAVVGIASYKMGQEDDSAGFAVSVKELKPFLSGQ